MTVAELRSALADKQDDALVIVMVGTPDGFGALDNLRDFPIQEVTDSWFRGEVPGDMISLVIAVPEDV